MAGKTKTRKTRKSGARARKASSRSGSGRTRPARPAARISAADPLRDLCRAYHKIRPILQALYEADVLNPDQQADLRLFMAMMDVLCGAAQRRGRTRAQAATR